MLEPLAAKGTPAVRGLAHYHLARAALADGQAERGAEAVWRPRRRPTPRRVGTPDALLFKGELYEKLGKTKEAAEAYRRLADTDGNAEKGLLPLIRLEVATGARPTRWTTCAATRWRSAATRRRC